MQLDTEDGETGGGLVGDPTGRRSHAHGGERAKADEREEADLRDFRPMVVRVTAGKRCDKPRRVQVLYFPEPSVQPLRQPDQVGFPQAKE